MSHPVHQNKRHKLVRFFNWLDARTGSPDRPVTSLEMDVLLQQAKRKAGAEDFGSNSFLEPLTVLLDAAKEPGALTFTGRFVLHRLIVNLLQTRLHTEQAVQRHPEILDQPIKRPLVVVGAPRTGTTLLSHLLAQDPMSRPLPGWEAFHPAPRSLQNPHAPMPRHLQLRGTAMKWVAIRSRKKLQEAHSFAYDEPDECHWLFFSSFICPPLMAFSSYKEWLVHQPDSIYDDAYQEYRRALQMLEWQRPARGHWVLKSPLHAWALDAYAKAIPEAALIQTHRRLDEVIPSACSLANILLNLFTDRADSRMLGDVMQKLAREFTTRFMAARERMDSHRILDLRYPDLVADPAGSVRRIYDQFGYDFTPEFERRIEAYLSNSTASAPGKHRYTLEQFGLDRDCILQECEDYHQAFRLI